MKLTHKEFHQFPETFLRHEMPGIPLYFLDRSVLRRKLSMFQTGFEGETSFAVKANPSAQILELFCDAGLRAFDVASLAEMRAVRHVCPDAILHYHNPLRSEREIQDAKRFGISSWSVDSVREFLKLGSLPRGTEIAVRLKLPTQGGAYNFGEKFGATEEEASIILKAVSDAGYSAAMTFHPGTQCEAPTAWRDYIEVCARVANSAGVHLKTLNVGGGFPANRSDSAPDLSEVFSTIHEAVDFCFGGVRPRLVCEPGRALVADAVSLALQIKVIRDNGDIILNDGMYGGLGEWRDISKLADRHIHVVTKSMRPQSSKKSARKIYGPTCDSIDCLPFPLELPVDVEEGDYVLFGSMGAYAQSLCTDFNGYGRSEMIVYGE